MDEQQVLALIQQYIVANGNNEITADVLRPVLEAILAQPNDLIGNISALSTTANTNLVDAVNELNTAIQTITGSDIQIFTGIENPNDVPPSGYNVVDFYVQEDGDNNVVALFQYNGFSWVSPTDQDNIDIVKTVKILNDYTDAQILEKINERPTYTVNEKQSLWILCITSDVSPPKILKYKVMNKGKGTYGVAGTQFTASDIELVYVSIATPTDIEIDPATDTIDFGDIEEIDVSEWLNGKDPAITIQPQDEGYTLFQGTVDGEEKSYLWIGAPGLYGDGETQSTMADFQLISDTAPSPGVQSVTGDSVDNTDPLHPVVNATTLQQSITASGDVTSGYIDISTSDYISLYGSDISMGQTGGGKIELTGTNVAITGGSADPDANNNIAIQAGTNGAVNIGGNENFKGAEYLTDYSANYTNRSIPDVEWVENAIAAIPEGIPYTGATGDVDLGSHVIQAYQYNDNNGRPFITPAGILQSFGNFSIEHDTNGFASFLNPNNLSANRTNFLPNAGGTFAVSVNGNTADVNGEIAVAVPTLVEYPETTYGQTPTIGGGTPPSGTMVGNWQATQIGKHVTARINIYYTTPGASNTSAVVPFPSGLPIPAAVTGFNATNNHVVICQGSMFSGLTTDLPTLGRATLKKISGGYEIRIMQTSIAATGILILLDYWTD